MHDRPTLAIGLKSTQRRNPHTPRIVTALVSIAIGAMTSSVFADESITGIITDFNGFYESYEGNVSTVRPSSAHNLVGFQQSGTVFSTGVNDQLLVANDITYTPALFKALVPFSFVSNNVGQGSEDDGNPDAADGPIYPIVEKDITEFLVDGTNGLGFSTFGNNVGITVNFNLSNVEISALNDGIPEFMYYNNAAPSGSAVEFTLYDENDVQLGITASSPENDHPTIATVSNDRYSATSPFNVLHANQNIGVQGFTLELSDFGVTAAELDTAVRLEVTLPGAADPPFVAYNAESILACSIGDTDKDRVCDLVEGSQDTDNDGLGDDEDTDSDGDSIPDIYEGTGDTDSDGNADYLDLDSDNDGILDSDEDTTMPDETGIDTDNDGIDDAFDVDATGGQDLDNDGFDDALEPRDFDNDGFPDYIDSDSDNDDNDDSTEGNGDFDNDGTPDYLDSDSDNDGISDADEGSANSDNDSLPDYLDSDSDNDGIPDVVEGSVDTDGDGVADYLDSDSDNDGLSDNEEDATTPALLGADDDNDGIDNAIDVDFTNGIDSNSNGVDDAFEPTDTDNDGTPDHLDIDSDGDGIADVVEVPGGSAVDSDGDGVSNHLDTDSDNDGIPDAIEDSSSPALSGIDADNDGIDDAIDIDFNAGVDANTNGIADALEPSTLNANGIPNHLNIDSDEDGITDVIEAGANPTTPADTDGDGVADYIDTDSDNDGIDDAVEDSAAPTLLGTDADNDGIDDAIDIDSTTGTDDNSNGIDDAFEPTDTDNDGIADYQDTDSDNDSIADVIENAGLNGSLDTDSDGMPDHIDNDADNDGLLDIDEDINSASLTGLDSDNDGIDNYLDVDATGGTDDNNNGIDDDREPADNDGDGIPNQRDLDSDNDGISDATETLVDSDNDGLSDAHDPDSDNDGLPDAIEGGADTDADGDPNYLDLDSDNDGLTDAEEGSSDTDNDGVVDFLDGDTDNDGILDFAEGLGDTDGDGIPDFQDQDSDNDGIPDSVEVGDNPNGVDSDGDGIPDFRDLDSDNDGVMDQNETAADTDGDGIADYLDLDSDNDSLPDYFEAGGTDTDRDGVVDGFVDSNSDGLDDGIASFPLEDTDSDNDGSSNRTDIDSDNDGLPDLIEAHNSESDQDRNGRLDNFVDTNGDGLDDRIAQEPIDVDDLDEDGTPDHLDSDSDNDGVPDLLEAGGQDANGDGVVDSLADDDNDGIPNSVDVDFTLGNDADNDGIDDSADINFNAGAEDTDDDGVIDERDPDSDGNGLADPQIDGSGAPDLTIFPDANGNGTADIDEPGIGYAAGAGSIHAGLSGAGCSVSSSGSKDPLLPMLAMASFLLMMRRRIKPRVFILTTLSVSLGALGIQSNSAIAAEESVKPIGMVDVTYPSVSFAPQDAINFQSNFYAGLGFGSSRLAPDTGEVSFIDVENGNSTGAQIMLGWDMNKWLSLELHATTLGDAELSTGSSISYDSIGASGLFYMGKARKRFKRQGFSAFGRLGYGQLTNERSDSSFEFETDNPNHVIYGLGLEYIGRHSLGVRAEGISFDFDVQYAQLSALYRFGKRKRQRPVFVVKHQVQQMPVYAPVSAISVAQPEAPASTSCSSGALKLPDRKACKTQRLDIKGLIFPSDSAYLTDRSRRSLNKVVRILKENPQSNLTLSAHTDNLGSATSNLDLSKRRVQSVSQYLQDAGIDKNRLTLKSFGELLPIATNDTIEGRRKNRRVEFDLES